MNRSKPATRVLSFSGTAALLVVLLGGLLETGEPAASPQNLDLPYNASGEGVDEDLVPAIISFYGGVYEANSAVFCLDYSESMSKRGELELQTREALRTIDDLHPRTRFGIVFYGGQADLFRPGLVNASESEKSAAKQAVVSTKLSLGTCMGPALTKALRLAKEEKGGVVILAGDGKPTTCPHGDGPDKATIRRQILARSAAANRDSKIVIHTIYVGDPSNYEAVEFMRKVSLIHGGTFRVVPTK